MRLLQSLLPTGLIVCLLIGISGCQTGRQAMMSQQKESQYEVPEMQLAAGLEPEAVQQVETAAVFEEEAEESSGADKWAQVWNRFRMTPSKPIPATVAIRPSVEILRTR